MWCPGNPSTWQSLPSTFSCRRYLKCSGRDSYSFIMVITSSFHQRTCTSERGQKKSFQEVSTPLLSGLIAMWSPLPRFDRTNNRFPSQIAKCSNSGEVRMYRNKRVRSNASSTVEFSWAGSSGMAPVIRPASWRHSSARNSISRWPFLRTNSAFTQNDSTPSIHLSPSRTSRTSAAASTSSTRDPRISISFHPPPNLHDCNLPVPTPAPFKSKFPLASQKPLLKPLLTFSTYIRQHPHCAPPCNAATRLRKRGGPNYAHTFPTPLTPLPSPPALRIMSDSPRLEAIALEGAGGVSLFRRTHG